MRQVERLVAADAVPVAWPGAASYRIWPDFPVTAHIDASCVTVKADAARRSFNAYGDASCGRSSTPASTSTTRTSLRTARWIDPDVVDLHRDFTADGEPDPGRRR